MQGDKNVSSRAKVLVEQLVKIWCSGVPAHIFSHSSFLTDACFEFAATTVTEPSKILAGD